MLNLITNNTGQLLRELFTTGGLEIVRTGMGLWETMCTAMTDLTLSAGKVRKCEFLGAAGAAIFGGVDGWNRKSRRLRYRGGASQKGSILLCHGYRIGHGMVV
jgi:hypothetical protein